MGAPFSVRIRGLLGGLGGVSGSGGTGGATDIRGLQANERAFERSQRLQDISAEEQLRLEFERERKRGGFNINAFLRQLQEGTDAANLKNEERFAEINVGFEDRLARANELLQGQGDVARQQLRESGEQALGASQQDLTSRGLANTSILSSDRAAINRGTDLAFASLSERLASSQFQAEDLIRGQQLAFQERREDVGPDLQSLLPLLLQLGR